MWLDRAVICRTKQLSVTTQAMHVWHNNEACFVDNCSRGKSISITYSQCVSVALVTQHETRMRRTMLPSVAWSALPCFSTLSHTRYNLPKNVFWLETCALIFYKTFVRYLFVSGRIQRDIVISGHTRTSIFIKVSDSKQVWFSRRIVT